MPPKEPLPAAPNTHAPAKPEHSGGPSHSSTSHAGGSHGPPHGGHEEGHEGAPEWLISFADNVTLMMGFFVVMLSMSMAAAAAGGHGGDPKSHSKPGESSPQQAQEITPQMIDLMISIREGFNNPVNANNPAPGEEAMAQRLRQLAAGDASDAGLKGDKAAVQSLRDTDYHALSGFVLFEPRSAELSGQARADLAKFASLTKGLRLVVEIRAHASAAEAFGQSDRGIRFSLDRGLAVAKFLAAQGLEWEQLRVIPQGDTDPIETRVYDSDSHAHNACVEFRVSDELMRR